MLKREKLKKWFYNEIKSINEAQFQFRDKEFALKYSYGLSTQMLVSNLLFN